MKSLVSILPLSVATRLRQLKHSISEKRTARADVFANIHADNFWRSEESVSGPGSELSETEDVRALLQSLLKRYEIKTLLDAPCGDFHWMKHVNLSTVDYIGVEIVHDLVESNLRKYGGENKRFIFADLKSDNLPRADLALCRDCLIHMSFQDALATLANLKRSGSKYLLITTDSSVAANRPINTGEYRAINLQLPPFSMGKPIELHRDRRSPIIGEELVDPSKSLALYRLN